MTVYWTCTCGETGNYPAAIPLKTDRALPDAKHQATCHGSVTTRVTVPVICGARETRPDGSFECVRPPQHEDVAHYWVRLTQRKSA